VAVESTGGITHQHLLLNDDDDDDDDNNDNDVSESVKKT